jgi:hypothetical protein
LESRFPKVEELAASRPMAALESAAPARRLLTDTFVKLSSRLVVLGALALNSLVHVACTATESVSSGGADLSQDENERGYGYGHGYGAAMNVAPDTSE